MPKKKVKHTRMFLRGSLPKTKEEKEKVYQFLEATGFMKQLLESKEIILIREE